MDDALHRGGVAAVCLVEAAVPGADLVAGSQQELSRDRLAVQLQGEQPKATGGQQVRGDSEQHRLDALIGQARAAEPG